MSSRLESQGMTHELATPRQSRFPVIAIVVVSLLAIAVVGISLLVVVFVYGRALGNWATPAPSTLALYDGITLSSGDLGDTFDSVTFNDPDEIPLEFEVQIADEGKMKLRELAHDPERISQLPQAGGFSGGMLSAAKGPCNLLMWMEGSEVRWIRLSQADCPERIPIFVHGTELRFPVTRSQMGRMFGNKYRLE